MSSKLRFIPSRLGKYLELDSIESSQAIILVELSSTRLDLAAALIVTKLY